MIPRLGDIWKIRSSLSTAARASAPIGRESASAPHLPSRKLKPSRRRPTIKRERTLAANPYSRAVATSFRAERRRAPRAGARDGALGGRGFGHGVRRGASMRGLSDISEPRRCRDRADRRTCAAPRGRHDSRCRGQSRCTPIALGQRAARRRREHRGRAAGQRASRRRVRHRLNERAACAICSAGAASLH